MNKLYVLAKNQETYFCKRLTTEVGNSAINFINPWIAKDWPREGQILVRTTAVYGSDDDLAFLQTWRGAILNPLDTLTRFRSKNSQYTFLAEENVPILPWIKLEGHSLEQVLTFFNDWGEKLLVKPDRGQGGWGVEVLNRPELEEWWKKGDHEFLLQPFVEGARELRTFFCDGMESVTLERLGTGGAANFRQGGSAKLADLKHATKVIIENLRKKSGAVYGAIDFFETDHGPKILELNVCPGIEQLEALTGINVIKHVLANLRT